MLAATLLSGDVHRVYESEFTVCSRLEERVLRPGLELELQRRDVARGEVDACAQINR